MQNYERERENIKWDKNEIIKYSSCVIYMWIILEAHKRCLM